MNFTYTAVEGGSREYSVRKTGFTAAYYTEFFILSSGLAGEVLQKLINYGGRIAIYGDYSRYTSKPLKDFIFESNKGRGVFFTATRDEALALLSKQS